MKCPKCGSKNIRDLTKENKILKCRICGYQDVINEFEEKSRGAKR